MQTAEAGCFEVKFRGRVTGYPDFGGAVGVMAVNVEVETIIYCQSSDLHIGDLATVSWPVIARYQNMNAQVGDFVEVYGLCCKDSVPSWWSNAGTYMVSISANEQYYMGVSRPPGPSSAPPWWFWAIIVVGTAAVIVSLAVLSRRKHTAAKE